MPVSSSRVALAPININLASPLQNRKNGPTAHRTSALSSLPLTPSLTPKISLTKSASVLVPSKTSYSPARKMESFSDYKITNSRNVKADLAATKLKLRLQLAFYKIKSQRDAALASCPTIRVAKTTTSTSARPRFLHSANVNLQKPRRSSAARLHALAAKRVKPDTADSEPKNTDEKSPADSQATQPEGPSTKAASLKLFHIKPTSAFHNSYPNHLPLTSTNHQRLPPVHKILKTPIKAANSRRMVGTSNSDETIDETADETALDFVRRKDDVLGSSPLRHSSFGTPNSFSVAKSLLQLGSGYY